MKFLIIGAGIGGLTLGGFFQQAGFDFRMVERDPEFRAIGTGISLSPNSLSILHRLGLADKVAQHGQATEGIRLVDDKGCDLNYADLRHFKRDHGFPNLVLPRNSLHEILQSSVDPGRISMGMTVQSVDFQSDACGVIFSDGSQGRYDLVIGADGIYSLLRKEMFGLVGPRFVNQISWSFTIPNTFFSETVGANLLGPDMRMGILPLPDRKLYCWATRGSGKGQEWMQGLRGTEVAQCFSALGGDAPKVWEQVNAGTQMHFARMYEVKLRQWVRERAVLLGDAAHAITPNLGQGAGLAIEDAACLHDYLHSSLPLSIALLDYQRLRMARVRNLQSHSYFFGLTGQFSNPFLITLRNTAYKTLPQSFYQNTLERLLFGNTKSSE